MGQQTKEYEWKKSPTRSSEMGQVLTEEEIESVLRVCERAAINSRPASARAFARQIEAAVLAKVEPEARHREQKAFASGGLWVSPCSLPVAGITHVTCTHCERIAKEALRRFPLPTKAREGRGAALGTFYKVVDNLLIRSTDGANWFRIHAIPVEDAAVVTDLLQHPVEPA